MLQNLMSYPALTIRLVTAPRGIESMVAMFLVAPLINRVDNRLIILFGLLLTAVSMWQMVSYSLHMGIAPIVISGLLQGFGLGCTPSAPKHHRAVDTEPGEGAGMPGDSPRHSFRAISADMLHARRITHDLSRGVTVWPHSLCYLVRFMFCS
jgi:hypothetical protein